jgi:hypothetical protein
LKSEPLTYTGDENIPNMHKNAVYRFFIGIRLGCKTAVPTGLRLLDL